MSVVQSIDAQVVTNVALVTNFESTIVASVPTAVETPTCKVLVKALAIVTPNTGTTAITLRLYRGANLSGLLISTATAQAGNFTVGTAASFVLAATDLLANAGGAQYTFTVTAVGASVNGTVAMACLETTVLSG